MEDSILARWYNIVAFKSLSFGYEKLMVMHSVIYIIPSAAARKVPQNLGKILP